MTMIWYKWAVETNAKIKPSFEKATVLFFWPKQKVKAKKMSKLSRSTVIERLQLWLKRYKLPKMSKLHRFIAHKWQISVVSKNCLRKTHSNSWHYDTEKFALHF